MIYGELVFWGWQGIIAALMKITGKGVFQVGSCLKPCSGHLMRFWMRKWVVLLERGFPAIPIIGIFRGVNYFAAVPAHDCCYGRNR